MKLSFSDPLCLALLLLLLPLARVWMRRSNALTPQRRRTALVLRSLTLVCVIFALAGAQMVRLTKDVTVLFLMDRSLSTGGDSQGWQRDYAARALTSRGTNDQYGLVLFGKDTQIELSAGAHERRQVEAFTAVTDRSASNLTSALRFAATAFPGDSASRLVVLSDGQSTEAESADEVAALAAAGIEVWTVPLPDSRVRDVLLSRLEAPNQIASDEPFVLRTVIESAGISEAELLISSNGKPQERIRVKLRDGPNLFLIPQRIKTPGPVRFEARVLSSDDQRPENNKGESLLVVGHEQTVLVLRQDKDPGWLVPLLRRAGLKARAVTSRELPRRVGAWRDVSALVIEDVNAIDWSTDLQKVVSLLVRDGGMGLLMLGSDATFGVGGYQHSPIEPLLPVNLAIRRPKDMPQAALVQMLDKSGSMGGRPIEMAREAAIASGETLSEKDYLGVVGFDDAARWVYKFQEKGDGAEFKKRVAGLRAGGGTDLYPAMKQGLDELVDAKASLKHIIVLSDGVVAPGDYDGLLRRAVEHRVTVSAIALGSGADLTFLTDLTKKGKGRLYVAPEANAGAPLPQIFIRDTLLATGAGVQDKPSEVRPTSESAGSPLLEGLDFTGTPRLLAYNMASAKGGTASTLLSTPKKDPILAVGRAGLGKTAAWTSDLGKWAHPWQTVPGAGGSSLLETILLRTVRSVTAAGDLGERSRGNQLEAHAQTVGDLSSIDLRLRSQQPLKGPVKAVVVNSRGESVETVLHPENPYLASGTISVSEPGSALIFAQDPDGQLLARCNLSVPLTPEFAKLGTNHGLLKQLAERSGGEYDAAADLVFRAPNNPFPIRTPLGPDLIRGALLLLLLEIAVRRLPLPKRSRKTNPGRQSPAATASLRETMAQLRESRRTALSPSQEQKPVKTVLRRSRPQDPPKTPISPVERNEGQPPTKPVDPSSAGRSTMDRLREAKKRHYGDKPPS